MKPINLALSGYSTHPEPFHHDFPNGLDTYIIRLQSEGISRALVDGTLIDITPGDLLLFKPGDLYELRVGEAGEPVKPNGDYFIMTTGEGMDEWWLRKKRPTKTKIAEDGRIKTLWHQIIMEKRRLDGGQSELVTLLILSLLTMLDRAIEEAPTIQSASAYHAIRMRNFVEAHASQEIRLEDVARDAGLSVSRTVHLFKDYYGTTIIGYLQQIRMAHAVDLLHHSPLSLEQIAAETGLGSYAYFHRVFRAQYGMAPGAYRKKKYSGHQV